MLYAKLQPGTDLSGQREATVLAPGNTKLHERPSMERAERFTVSAQVP